MTARQAQALGFDEPGIKITFPASGLSDDSLRFMQQIGVRWITAGGPNSPRYNERGQVTLPDGDTNTDRGAWKDEELRAMTDRAESFGLKIGNLMLHDFRDVILGRERRSVSADICGRIAVPPALAGPSATRCGTAPPDR